ncbi:MAG: prepilin-type N-terminal cleavage/methylation domain-containing protein, partial [Syntrophobacteraceae bacterium]|nr:prepilin-type N-terminal cleavage/methylation domain-containing protein [Syntrophobacteraceae bacterium]
MSRCLRPGNTDSGFTLVEVLVSLGAMAIGFTILMGMHYSSIKMEMSDQRRVQALEIARTNLEILRDLNGWDRVNCPS